MQVDTHHLQLNRYSGKVKYWSYGALSSDGNVKEFLMSTFDSVVISLCSGNTAVLLL